MTGEVIPPPTGAQLGAGSTGGRTPALLGSEAFARS